jgi:hypothetical protein
MSERNNREIITGSDTYSIGDIEGSKGVAIGPGAKAIVNEYGSDNSRFQDAYKAIDHRPEDPDVDKQEIAQVVKAIERESSKEVPSEDKIKPRIEVLKRIAPDIVAIVSRVLSYPPFNG